MNNRMLCNKIIEMLRQIAKTIVCFAAVTAMAFELWEPYEAPKNRWFYLGVILFLILIILMRKISYKDTEVWISVVAGFCIMFFYFRANNLNPDYYGEIYSKVISYTFVIAILFFALVANSIRRKLILSTIRNNWMVLIYYTLVAVVSAVIFRESIATLIIPMYALVFSDIDEHELVSTFGSLSVSMYLSFVFIYLKCIVEYPNVYESGRYMGGFCSVENIGMFCGGAVVSCIYFFIKCMHAERKKWYLFVLIIVLVLFPCFAITRTDSRSAVAGVGMATLISFTFVQREKNVKKTVRRVFASAVICMSMGILLCYLGKYLNNGLKSGKFSADELGYTLMHVQVLGDENSRSGYFGENSFLNSINRFSANRLTCYAEAIKQIEWKGHEFRSEPPYNYTTPHNFFIMRLINMGIVPGTLLCIWIAFLAIKECILCARGVKTAIFPLLWTMYTIAVLSFTITKWNSLLPFLMFFSSIPVLVKGKFEKEN